MVNICTAPCHINNLCILHKEFKCFCESQSKSDYFPKHHSPNSLHSLDGLCSVWRKKSVCICSLYKPADLHSVCVFDRPTEDDEFLRKFRVAMRASHAALSKPTSKNFCQKAVFPTLSKIVKMSKSVAKPKSFPLLHTRSTVHLLCITHTPRLYLVSSLTLPEGRACTA